MVALRATNGDYDEWKQKFIQAGVIDAGTYDSQGILQRQRRGSIKETSGKGQSFEHLINES